MIDLFSLLLSHGLMLLAAWRLIKRDDLDIEKGHSRRRFKRTTPRA